MRLTPKRVGLSKYLSYKKFLIFGVESYNAIQNNGFYMKFKSYRTLENDSHFSKSAKQIFISHKKVTKVPEYLNSLRNSIQNKMITLYTQMIENQ